MIKKFDKCKEMKSRDVSALLNVEDDHTINLIFIYK